MFAHRLNGAFLVRVERRTRLAGTWLIVSRLVGPGLVLSDQAFFPQGLRSTAPGRQLLGQGFDIQAVAAGIQQQLEEFGLARRPSGQGFEVGLFAGVGRDNVKQYGVQRLALSQQCRQGGRDDFAYGMVVIAARETDEPEIVLRQHGLTVQCRDATLYLATRELALRSKRGYDGGLPAVAEWHQHATPGLRRRLPGGRQIVELT